MNALSEFTNVSRTGTFTVAGGASDPATSVTLNGSAATLYTDKTFAKVGITLADGTNTFTAVATDAYGRWATNTINANLPSTINLLYDANGNLRTNGTHVLEYDDENQLVTVQVPNSWRSDFVYDGKMRRRERWESTWDGSNWLTNLLVRYVYDGMLAVQERHYNPQLSTLIPQLVVSYTRGRDLSGSLQGAGGIGGLLARTESGGSAIGGPLATAFYFADNVGNVTTLASTNGLVVARYLYEPFGNIIAMGGPLADRNLYRFSSKEWHERSGLVYYGYRFYSPSLQRWINRDPVAEIGGINVYRYLLNNPTGAVDPDGRNMFLLCCIPCVGYLAFDLVDAVQGTCAGKTGSDLNWCVVREVAKLAGISELVSCMYQAVVTGGSPKQIGGGILKCVKDNAGSVCRDVAKAVTCACCAKGVALLVAAAVAAPKPVPPTP